MNALEDRASLNVHGRASFVQREINVRRIFRLAASEVEDMKLSIERALFP